MDIGEMYKIARVVAPSVQINGLSHDDKVQEAVILSWLLTQTRSVNASYLKIKMRAGLMKLSRKQDRFIPLEWDIKASEPPNLPLPDDEKENELILAMLMNKAQLDGAASFLGWTYAKAYHVWRRAKRTMKKELGCELTTN